MFFLIKKLEAMAKTRKSSRKPVPFILNCSDEMAALSKAVNEMAAASEEQGYLRESKYFSLMQSLKEDPPETDEKLFIIAKFILLMINAADHYTLSHTEQVIKYSTAIADAMLLPKADIKNIKLGALFHDVGKIELKDRILNKEGPLTENEWNSVKEHPQWGAKILSTITEIKDVISFVRHHHERFDGKGYPDQLSGCQIPLGARIIAVADSFDAMTTHRPYHKARSLPEALKELHNNSRTQFDPEIVRIFMGIVHNLI